MFKKKNTLLFIILILIIFIGILYFIKENQVENFVSTRGLSKSKSVKKLRNIINDKNDKIDSLESEIYNLNVMVEDRDDIIYEVKDIVTDDDI